MGSRRLKPGGYSGDMRLAHGGIWLRVSGRISNLLLLADTELAVGFRGWHSIIFESEITGLSVMAEKQPFVWEEIRRFTD